MRYIPHDNSEPSVLGLAAAALIFDGDGRILLIKENYGRFRYGLPGGKLEAGENPKEALIREVMEETCVMARVDGLVGVYHFVPAARPPFMIFTFRCEIKGTPRVPDTGEIAEIGWFDPRDLPSPLTNLAPHAIADALRGACGLVSDPIYLP